MKYVNYFNKLIKEITAKAYSKQKIREINYGILAIYTVSFSYISKNIFRLALYLLK